MPVSKLRSRSWSTHSGADRVKRMTLPMPNVRRIDFGYFVRPAAETATGKPRVEGVLGYAIEHSGGLFLFDTGMGEGDPEVDAHYRPVRHRLSDAMRAA